MYVARQTCNVPFPKCSRPNRKCSCTGLYPITFRAKSAQTTCSSPHAPDTAMKSLSPESHYGTAASRWAGVGPYYAMFPVSFATAVVKEHTRRGDGVLDPFAGRATSLFAAASEGRFGLGVEINPVGWVYGKAKLQTATRENV